jgi:hypothetical protein
VTYRRPGCPAGLGFTDSLKGIAPANLDQLVDAPQLPAALALPMEIIVPGGSRPDQPSRPAVQSASARSGSISPWERISPRSACSSDRCRWAAFAGDRSR